MFDISFSKNANKEFCKLEEKYKAHAETILKILNIDPVPVKFCDVKKLKGMGNTFRIRIGKLRIVYIIDWKEKQIIIARISFRENVY